MAKSRQAPAPLGATDPKAPTPPEDLNPDTQENPPETETPTPDPQPTPTPDPEPKQSEDPEADTLVEVVVVHPEPPEPEPTWKEYPPLTDHVNDAWVAEIQARQVFKILVRFQNKETKELSFVELDRLQLVKDQKTGEYSIQSRM